MIKATKFFKINKEQQDIDFVNINMNGDTKLFINPTLLEKSTYDPLAHKGTVKVETFFGRVFTLYSKGERDEALSLFTSSHETNANHLGYSKGESRGNGASKRALAELFDTILATGALAEEIMTKPISILIFAHDFGEDRMSDLVTSILKEEFVNYSLMIAKKYGIRVENTKISYGNYWNDQTLSWETLKANWIKGIDGNPILFTPKQIVSQKYGFSVRSYVTQVVWTWRKDYHVSNKTKLALPHYDKTGILTYKAPTNTVLRHEEIDKEYQDSEGKWKQYALEMTIKNPKLYKQYVERYSNGGVSGDAQILSDEMIVEIVNKE